MKTISIFYCLLYAARIEGADINVEGLEGEDVSFQCSHRLAWKNNKYFCKDPCKDSEDVLVTVQSSRRVKSGRIALVDSGNGVFTVTISQLQLSDSGRYWCAVDRPGFDAFTAVHLTVKEAMNSTNGGGQNIITGILLYPTVGAVATLTILVLTVMIVRNRKENSKPQPQVCSDNTNLVRAEIRGVRDTNWSSKRQQL
ncbi:hypothetical protein FQN60_012238 [Etheostoma spectabile]|uniref:Immunoglobulin domain-containing protein n=1 Tax=Etheostoma spectabile TaxID=54343 RepID=A0A5J5DPH9_9PERO|nr:hypothetical protein FQN60_012238 [Etheostoma spectabile]